MSRRIILALLVNVAAVLGLLWAMPFSRSTAQVAQCTFSLPQPTQIISAIGATGTFTMMASNAQCAWTARSNVPWITLNTAASGSGTTTIRYTVMPTVSARQGTLTLGGNLFTIYQEFNACSTFSLTGLAQTATLPMTPSPVGAPNGGLRSFETAHSFLRDFNKDGRLDLVAVGGENNYVALYIFLGQTGNAWSAPLTPLSFSILTEFNARISGVAVADFNRDGNLDLAALSEAATQSGEIRAQLWLIYGNGAGGFAAPQATALPTRLQVAGLAAGDFNNDNFPDVAVGHSGTPRGLVYLNNGTGGWRAPLNLPAALEAYGVGAPIHITDLDGDGKQDLLWNDAVSLKGDGAGNFSVLQVLPRSTKAFGDFNGDGKVDIIYFEVDANDRSLLQIALNDGSGRMVNGPRVPLTLSRPALEDITLTTADFNLDGRADVVARYRYGWQVLFSIAGSRLLGEPQLYLSGFVQQQFPLSGDLNRDGKSDLHFLYGGGIETMLGSGTSFNGVRGFRYSDDIPRGGAFAVGDVNGDSWPDVVTPGAMQNQIRILSGNGRGDFTIARTLTATFDTLGEMQAMALRDFNRDGSLDLAVLYRAARTVEIWLNDGRGAFASRLKIIVGANATELGFADFNQDGTLDLVTNGAGGGFALYQGNGRGDFAPSAASLGGANAGVAFEIADVHGDGKRDLIFPEPGISAATRFLVLPGNGQGGFGAAEFITAPSATADFVMGDLNADGRADLVYRATTEISSYNVILSQGATGWASPSNYSEFGNFGGGPPPRLGDLNGDGKLDFYTQGLGVVRLGRGDGSFQPAILVPLGADIFDALPTDIDNDGYEDFIALSSQLSAIGVIKNRRSCLPAGGIVVTSAASYFPHRAATDGIFSIFGSNLDPTTQSARTVPLPTTLGLTSVRVRDSAGTEKLAPLFFVSPTQINFLLPSGLAAGGATVNVLRESSLSSVGTLLIEPVAPGLFAANATGQGLAAAVALRIRANGAQVYEPISRVEGNRLVAVPLNVSNQAEQVYLVLYGTGWRNRTALAAVSAQVGGLAAEVSYAGAQGGFAGLDQLNLRLPSALAGRGEVSIEIIVDGRALNPVSVVIQ